MSFFLPEDLPSQRCSNLSVFVKMVRLPFKPVSSSTCSKLLEKTRDTKATHGLAAMSIYYIWHPDFQQSGQLRKEQKKVCSCCKGCSTARFFQLKVLYPLSWHALRCVFPQGSRNIHTTRVQMLHIQKLLNYKVS